MEELETMLNSAFSDGASDVIYQVGQPVIKKIQGRLVPQGDIVKTESEIQEIIQKVAGNKCLSDNTKTDYDCSYQVPSGRLRVNIGYEKGNPFIFFRLIPANVPEFSSLGLPVEILSLSENKRGIVLVTGPVGMGKSTTLASMIKHIVTHQQRCIITLEDPIEFVYENTPTKSLILQREIGRDVPDFATGLRQALRENPDIILVGEMRDRDTVESAFNAALSGHLVLGTVHTISSVQTVDRLVSLFPESLHPDARMQLSLSLKGIVAQALLPRKDGNGRIPCVEFLPIVSDDIRKFIREGTPQKIRQFIEIKSKTGAYPFDIYLARLVLDGFVSEDVAIEFAQEPDTIMQKITRVSEETNPTHTASWKKNF
ncbi:MAG: type IV pilus twitching motility protein PilT [bacterium]